MSLKNRHTTIGLIIISLLLIINSIVVIRFFTDDEFKEVTYAQASLDDCENIVSTKVANLNEQEIIDSANNKDTVKNTNEIKNTRSNNNDIILINTNDEKNIPNTKNEKKIINTQKNIEQSDIPMQVIESDTTEENVVPMQVSEVKTPSSRSSFSRKSTEKTKSVELNKPQTEPHVEEQPTKTSDTVATTPSIPANQTSIGTIEIPATSVNLPILKKVSVAGMEVATCYLYSTGSINEYGTTIIVGHNYCNGKLFSNNKKLKIGDKVYITANGVRKEYTIYDKFITTDEDISYLEKNTSNEAQIALSTCTDNEQKRLVILAK